MAASSIQTFEAKVESNIVESNNLGTFYRYINKRMSHQTSIAAIHDKTGNLVVHNSDKANLFNQYFSSVGVIDNGILPTSMDGSINPTVLDSVVFRPTRSNVCADISKLKNNLSSGPDGLPPLLYKLKQLKYCLAEPLSLAFTQLLTTCCL